jgi:phenylalanine ammonia-lyase
MQATLERTSTMDAVDQMREVASSCSSMLLKFFTSSEFEGAQGPVLTVIPTFQERVALQATALLDKLRGEFLSGKRGASPASLYLGKTRTMYEYIRLNLGIKMHGTENYSGFANGLGLDDVTVGQNISIIYEVGGHMDCPYL